MPTMSSTLGIHRGLLLLVVISVILVAFVSASPSPQALSAARHQNIRGKPKDVRIPCNFNGVSLFSHNLFFSFRVDNRTKGERQLLG